MSRPLILLLWATAGTARAACPDEVTPGSIAELLDRAEQSYSNLDTDGFFLASDKARLTLECLNAVVPTRLAARYHRVEGLRRFTAGDVAGSEWALAGAGALEPDYEFPTELLPASHRLRETYLDGRALPTRFERLRAAADGDLLFDGVASPARPLERATIYQRTDRTGAVNGTWYLLPDSPIPPYAGVPRTRNRLLASAAASALGASTTAALGGSARARFNNRDTDQTLDDLKSLRTQTQVYGALTGVLSAASLGLATGALVAGDQ